MRYALGELIETLRSQIDARLGSVALERAMRRRCERGCRRWRGRHSDERSETECGGAKRGGGARARK